MLWTVFKIFVVVWMLQLVFRFGGNALQPVLVVSLAALLLRMGIPRTPINAGDLRHSTKTGRLDSSIAEPFAGDSKINSSFHNRT
jgi:hypothetical protein